MGKVFERVYEEVSVTHRRGVSVTHRVVGFALHQNPDPKNIPCHRVVFKDGSLAPGYLFGGKEKQKQLLLSEGVKFQDDRVKSCQTN